MIKATGFFLVLLSGILLALKVNQGYKKRIAELEAFLESVKLIKAEMEYLKTPLREIFTKTSKGENPIVNRFFNYLKDGLEAGNGLKALWNDGLEKFSKLFCLNQKDLQILSDFSVLLGQTDLANQIENIDNVADKLNLQLKIAQKEQAKNAKPQGTLYIAGSIALGLLFL